MATDVHAIAALDDAYNRDHMAHADILFMSHERLPVPPDAWAVMARHASAVLVIGLGADGALLAQRLCAGRGPRARGDHTPGGEHGGRGDSLSPRSCMRTRRMVTLSGAATPSSLPGTRSARRRGGRLPHRARAGGAFALALAERAACRPRAGRGRSVSPLLRRACRCGSRTPAPPPERGPPGSRAVTQAHLRSCRSRRATAAPCR
ncbi:MAG: hypothetical protein R3A10_15840 [Caldilineaceae bacterium]